MENPETWTDIHLLIHEGIEEYIETQRTKICGLSLETTIYNKLEKAGVLKEATIVQ